MKTGTIYKKPAYKQAIMHLYENKLNSFAKDSYEELDIDTFAGNTHIIVRGEKHLPAVVVFHGIHAGAPVALEAMRELYEKYRIYAVDTVGQATKSAETTLDFKNNEYGKWASEVLEKLGLESVPVIAISYGAFILNELIRVSPEKVKKAIYVVPSGFANGDFLPSLSRLSIPLFKFHFTKKEKDLVKFMNAFFDEQDNHWIEFQKNILLGVKMDYRRPPLMSEKDTQGFTAPVFAMIAEDDVFFPKEKAIPRIKKVFSDVREIYVLKDSKHIPNESRYDEIAEKIEDWLEE
ncbi:alpha/beta fold hydrolase [Bernardetia sp.]|uniref:alpha/beta fold hydrolase n=1 Tax=Bernardetia sp. TaxID=1937974 RepID=UPI0025C51B69|nr:alpha/beta hydrolase [Bernardetia sp.]